MPMKLSGTGEIEGYAGLPAFRNKIINGAMIVVQRTNGANVSVTTGGSALNADRFQVFKDPAGGGVLMGNPSPIVSTAPFLAGFRKITTVYVDTAFTSTAGQGFLLRHVIEGSNVADLSWGTASAKPVTLSFWCNSTMAGTYAVGLGNAGGDRNYVATYALTANVWTKVILTIPGCIDGAWESTNLGGIFIRWDLGSGTNFSTTTPNSWINTVGQLFRTAGSVNFSTVAASDFNITGVQLEVGNVATPFEHRFFGVELALCQRYFCKTYNQTTVPGTASFEGGLYSTNPAIHNYANAGTFTFPVTMRAIPTMTLYNANTGATGSVNSDGVAVAASAILAGQRSAAVRVSNVSVGADAFLSCHLTASAEL